MSSNPLILKPACLKTLSAVEARPERSRQHEFNGVSQLKDMFGLEKFEKNAVFHLRGKALSDNAKVTWYDARADHPTRTEHRLYFQRNAVMDQAQEGDNILIGFDRAGVLNCVLIKTGAEGYKANIPSWQAV
ncbi:hypothetical protein CLU93_2644 [Janthinobacterium sp. 35]|uniref:type II restriction endonuclease n=1 Tax=Janthinobacterium sp. 35 TaxID=2035210 RepID=UPI000C19F7B0|nr:type II restriction endonuclease [Janthinobacterium sp. 35]PIG28361.1 hypothetical protein CLU93_2644 [Janthinobacterium sp. 35]